MKLIFLMLGSGAYAVWLQTPEGKLFLSRRTAEAVVIGVSIVLIFLFFTLPVVYSRRVFLAFVLAGLPMVARSWYNRLK